MEVLELYIEYVSSRKMGTAGSILIDAIQNSHTPCLDLFVRESIQNSLDASDLTKKNVKVQFLVKEFQSDKLSGYFDDIHDVLDERYGNSKQDLLVVKDSNTVGLTGPVRTEGLPITEFGNFYKLVYDINKKQNQEGAGGAWGIGKTVYFRLGIGLVIYYTRIKTDDGYEERLAAALVEDESDVNPHHILPNQINKTRRGIAWWGDIDPEDKDSTIPVTDIDFIHEVLDVLGVEPYINAQTGTTVIIPYLRTADLLKELKYENLGDDAPYWCNGNKPVSNDAYTNRSALISYLNIATKKWYTPRMSSDYPGNSLIVKINDDLVKINDEQIFVLIERLYSSRPDDHKKFNGKDINSEPIRLQSTFVKDGQDTGWINYIKVTDKDFGSDGCPYYYLFNYRDPEITVLNTPIFMCCRKPGMIVAYEQGGLWMKNIPDTARDEYLFAFFIPNSKKVIATNNMSLDEYLRKGEQSDHMSWVDSIRYGNLRIVSRLQNRISDIIRKTYEPGTGIGREKHKANWGKVFASKLMPPTDFSKWDDAVSGHSGPGGTGGDDKKPPRTVSGRKNKKTISLKVEKTEFREDSVILKGHLFLGDKDCVVLGINVVSESGNMTCERWEKQMGTTYPISLNSLNVLTLVKQTATAGLIKSHESHLITEDCSYDYINYCFIKSEVDGHNVALMITPDKHDYYDIECEISFSLNGVKGNVFLKDI